MDRLADLLVGSFCRPSDIPLDLAGDLGDLLQVPLLRLDPAAARMIELERRRLKPRELQPW